MADILPCGLQLNVTVRPPADIPPNVSSFIVGTWATSGGRICVPKMGGAQIHDRTGRLAKRALHVLEAPSTYVALAEFVDGPSGMIADDLPVAWMVLAPNLCHFVFVRAPYRGLGVASLLAAVVAENFRSGLSTCPFPRAGWVPCTHWTTKLPKTGWIRSGERILFYAGFEPLEVKHATRDETAAVAA